MLSVEQKVAQERLRRWQLKAKLRGLRVYVPVYRIEAYLDVLYDENLPAHEAHT